jgi:hypothetical protein
LLRGVDHFEHDRGLAVAFDDGPQEQRLDAMVIGVVVLLADGHERLRSNTFAERSFVDEPRAVDVPDATDQRVLQIEA